MVFVVGVEDLAAHPSERGCVACGIISESVVVGIGPNTSRRRELILRKLTATVVVVLLLAAEASGIGSQRLQAQAYDDMWQYTNSDPVTLTITAVTGDFGITPPADLTLSAGNSGQSSVQLTPTDGFVGAVHLTVTGAAGILGPPGDPTKISASFDSATVNLDSTNTASTTLTLTAGAQVPPGTYSLQLTGTDNSGTKVHFVLVNVTVTPNSSLFSMTLDKTSVVGTYAGVGSIWLNNPAPIGGALIQLASDNLSVQLSANTVKVDAGKSYTTFQYMVDGGLQNTAVATISATYNQVTVSATLQLYPAIHLTAIATGHSKITLYHKSRKAPQFIAGDIRLRAFPKA